MSGILAAFTDPRIEAQMGKSTYEIRVAATVPPDLLENFRQIQTVEPAGRSCTRCKWRMLPFGA
jgi:hypothetical protein